jgi:hypothetical protein
MIKQMQKTKDATFFNENTDLNKFEAWFLYFYVKMNDFTDEEVIEKGIPLYLGVLGCRNDLIQQKVIEEVLIPIIGELGRLPDKCILPSEGSSSIFLSDWAESLKIPLTVYEADWRRHLKRAKLFRDSRIQKESTHFIIFLNKRSEANQKIAYRLCNLGKKVFTVSYKDNTIEELVTHYSEIENLQEEHGSKLSTGKEQGLRQWMQLEDLENRCLLINP